MERRLYEPRYERMRESTQSLYVPLEKLDKVVSEVREMKNKKEYVLLNFDIRITGGKKDDGLALFISSGDLLHPGPKNPVLEAAAHLQAKLGLETTAHAILKKLDKRKSDPI